MMYLKIQERQETKPKCSNWQEIEMRVELKKVKTKRTMIHRTTHLKVGFLKIN